MKPPVITLTTDFGISDVYVGIMKGVMLQGCPEAVIVDITHDVAPQNVSQAAFRFDQAFDCFPEHSIHVIVVDPGVGTSRAIVAADMGGPLVLAPDNGVLTLLLQRQKAHRIYQVTHTALFRHPVSRTFHGRDIFAPVAAALAHGLPAADLGPAVQEVKMLPALHEVQQNQAMVIDIDRFGNLVLSVKTSRARGVMLPDGRVLTPMETYSDAAIGEPLLLFGSHGHWEIAVNQSRADEKLALGLGDKVRLQL